MIDLMSYPNVRVKSTTQTGAQTLAIYAPVDMIPITLAPGQDALIDTQIVFGVDGEQSMGIAIASDPSHAYKHKFAVTQSIITPAVSPILNVHIVNFSNDMVHIQPGDYLCDAVFLALYPVALEVSDPA